MNAYDSRKKIHADIARLIGVKQDLVKVFLEEKRAGENEEDVQRVSWILDTLQNAGATISESVGKLERLLTEPEDAYVQIGGGNQDGQQ